MAYKRTTRKVGGTKTTTTYNNKTGFTRRSQTVKPTKSMTITRSLNKNGSIKTTTTQNINGWITRKTSTAGSGIVKARKIRTPKYSSGRTRRSRGGGGDGGALILFVLGIIFGIFWLAWKGIVLLWQTAEATIAKPETEDLDKIVWYHTKVFCLFFVYVWMSAVAIYWIGVWLLK